MIAHCWYTSHAVGNYLSCLSTGGWALHLSANLLLLTISHRIRTRIVAYRCISQRIAENFSRRGSGNHVVLVRREWGAPSGLLNESAIVDYLSKRGFCVIDISQCSLDQLPEARQRRFRRCVGRRVTLTSRTFFCSRRRNNCSPESFKSCSDHDPGHWCFLWAALRNVYLRAGGRGWRALHCGCS